MLARIVLFVVSCILVLKGFKALAEAWFERWGEK